MCAIVSGFKCRVCLDCAVVPRLAPDMTAHVAVSAVHEVTLDNLAVTHLLQFSYLSSYRDVLEIICVSSGCFWAVVQQMQSTTSRSFESAWLKSTCGYGFSRRNTRNQRHMLHRGTCQPAQRALRRSLTDGALNRLPLGPHPKPNFLNEKDAKLGVPMHPIRIASLLDRITWGNIPAYTQGGNFFLSHVALLLLTLTLRKQCGHDIEVIA